MSYKNHHHQHHSDHRRHPHYRRQQQQQQKQKQNRNVFSLFVLSVIVYCCCCCSSFTNNNWCRLVVSSFPLPLVLPTTTTKSKLTTTSTKHSKFQQQERKAFLSHLFMMSSSSSSSSSLSATKSNSETTASAAATASTSNIAPPPDSSLPVMTSSSISKNSDETTTSSQSKSLYLFDDETWESYKVMITSTMTSKRALGKDTLESLQPATEYLLSRPVVDAATRTPETTNTLDNDDDVSLFQKQYNLTEAQYTYITRCLTYLGDACARNRSNGQPIVVGWYKLTKECFVKSIRENAISTYMYILGNSESNNDDNNSNNNNDNSISNQWIADTLNEVVSYHNDHFQPNEKTISLRIKYLITQKQDVQGAEQILASMDDNNNSNKNEKDNVDGSNANVKKLRTYLPIMEYYCNVAESPSDIVRVYQDMKQQPSVHMDSEFYALLISTLAKLGQFCPNNNDNNNGDGKIENASKDNENNNNNLGLEQFHGPKLFDEIASRMANDILELTEASAKMIFEGFQKGFSNNEKSSSLPTSEMTTWESLDKASTSSNGTTATNSTTSDDDDIIPSTSATTSTTTITNSTNHNVVVMMGKVIIDDTTAICPTTGVKLRLFALDEIQRQHVHDTLLEMAKIQHQEFSKKIEQSNKNKKGNNNKIMPDSNPNFGFESLWKFSQWLDTREGDPYTAIIDGPNVAYYGHGDVHYSQVKLLVETLEAMGENPLVTMSTKYTRQTFSVGPGRFQGLKDVDKEIINSLIEQEKMYVVPSFCLDDYYWMLASVSNQTIARSFTNNDNNNNKDPLRVSVHGKKEGDSGRFPGLRPMLVTNDQMRDHKLDLLEPREFRRWSSCHIVNYNISEYERDEYNDERNVELFPADFFSREIQGNQQRVSGSNSESTKGGLVWHFPISEWEESDRFFIWIK